jgi:hypothetical protein
MSGRRRAGDPAPLVGFGPALGANVDDANGSALGLLLDSLERAERDVASERIGRARGDDDADDESVVLARHSWLTGPNGYEVLGELRSRNLLDAPGHAALASHVARFVRERELARVRQAMRMTPDRVLEVGEHRLTVRSAFDQTLRGARVADHRALERALAQHADQVLNRVIESLDHVAQSTQQYAAWTADDVDRAPAGADERARLLLAETDELADEGIEYLRSRLGETDGELRTSFDLARSLRVRELDDFAPRASRAKRIAAWLAPSRFASVLERRATVDAPRPELGVGVTLVMATVDDARLLPGGMADGIVGELAMLETVGRALAILAANPGTPTFRRRPRAGFTGRALGSLLTRAAFDARALARHRTTPSGVIERARRTAAVATVLRVRIEAARVLVARGASAHDELERATRVSWAPSVARLACLGGNPDVEFDALRAGMSWNRALRERYDEDFLRDPVAISWFSSMLSRASIETPETFAGEIDAAESVAGEIGAFFHGRLP